MGSQIHLIEFPADDPERELGGEVIHPGARWAVCRDSEGSPFGLAASMT
ncbi:MAG TPA: hypothetical protein VG228_04360 [Solirubrobacteraceae bacterium]|nr:hypothetical protein [Solirubrobacteraceae bacterium]